ncbi:MAG: WYL domain-containing protein [Thiotrichales bacterium]|nr:WYL domain-containing protein [Thiotrichales bacterium]
MASERVVGTFQERPVDVVLRFDAGAAPDAAAFLFHPDQVIEEHRDGSLTVRFRAGGIDEMCWHLFTWGESVTIEKPAWLRKRLSEMCTGVAAHHGGDES